MSVIALLGLLSTAHAASPSSSSGSAWNVPQSSQDDEEETLTIGDEGCQYMSYMLPSEACMNSLHDELACSACPKTK